MPKVQETATQTGVGLFFLLFFKQEPTAGEKKCQRLVCQKRQFAARSSSWSKFKDPKFKHEIFVRIDMKHSYFSNYS